MSTTFTVEIDSASSLDHLITMAALRGERFFGDTPFEITTLKAMPRSSSTSHFDGTVTMTAVQEGDDRTGRQRDFTGHGSTPQEVEEDIICQAREFFGPDATLKVSRGYAFGSSASTGKPLRAIANVAMVEPGSVIVRPAAAADGREKC